VVVVVVVVRRVRGRRTLEELLHRKGLFAHPVVILVGTIGWRILAETSTTECRHRHDDSWLLWVVVVVVVQ